MPINKGYLTADKNDELFTTYSGVKSLIKYIDKEKTIWCPFDKEGSAFVKVLRENGNKVIYSHINDGKDFFEFEPKDHYDIIISNPPFSKKDEVLKRLFELNKPYAMLFPINVLQGQKRFEFLKDVQLLTYDKRINYFQNEQRTKMQKGCAFASGFLCKGILPKDLIIEKIQEK